MLFNLNEFLIAVSFTLDFVEMDILGVTTNHGKRTAYTSLKISKELGLSSEGLYDIVALAILHDNGVSEKSLHDRFLIGEFIDVKSIERKKEHCTIGEENVRQYPFLTDVRNAIKYHHEEYNGTGYFNLKGDEIPLLSQIIHMVDVMETNFDLQNNNSDMQIEVMKFINQQKNKMFAPKIVTVFSNIAESKEFWLNLNNDYIEKALEDNTPKYSVELGFDKIGKITGVFSRIIDSKSKFTQRHSKDLSDKVAIMANFYCMGHDEKMKLIIAANLHDIGKLYVPNSILDSPSKLASEEFDIIKKHPYFTRIALQEIKGFEDITEWASNHHEKLNGQGYPFGKTGKELDFNSRLLTCLDIYEALTEERPYRIALEHEAAMEILNKMKDNGFIDVRITEDINHVFSSAIKELVLN